MEKEAAEKKFPAKKEKVSANANRKIQSKTKSTS